MSQIIDGTWNTIDRTDYPWRIGYLPETRSYVANITCKQLLDGGDSLQVAVPDDSISSDGKVFYCCGNTDPTHIGGGVHEWTETWLTVPPDRIEYEQYANSYQYFSGGDLGEYTLVIPSKLEYRYAHVEDWEDPTASLTVTRAFRYFKVGSAIYYVGTPPAVDATEYVCEDTKLTRWRGNIWQAVTRWASTRAVTT